MNMEMVWKPKHLDIDLCSPMAARDITIGEPSNWAILTITNKEILISTGPSCAV